MSKKRRPVPMMRIIENYQGECEWCSFHYTAKREYSTVKHHLCGINNIPSECAFALHPNNEQGTKKR